MDATPDRMNADRLMNDVLRAHTAGRTLAEVMSAALAAVDPAAAVRAAMRREDMTISVGGRCYKLNQGGRVFVVGGGKAGAPMTQAAHECLGDVVAAGLVVVKEGHTGSAGDRVGNIEIVEASHPVPDERGVRAANRIRSMLRERVGADDLAIVLLSGGGSALLTLPVPGVSLEDLRQMIDVLLNSGATINEVNCLRKHCAQIGGGGLANFAAHARIATLILSDVIGSPLDVIASGPTVPDPTTFDDASEIVGRYELEGRLPATIINRLRRGHAGGEPETLKPDSAVWGNVHNVVIANNRIAAEACVAAARERGIDARVLTTFLEGEAREVGRVAAGIARESVVQSERTNRSSLIVCGGETTVTVHGQGTGGRNQELALGAVAPLAGVNGASIATLATDGGDGATNAAGAVVTGETIDRARALNLDPTDALRRNDSYNFFAPLGALLRPGPTLTNVNDLLFIYAAPPNGSISSTDESCEYENKPKRGEPAPV